mgnify:CR=1 FL=1
MTRWMRIFELLWLGVAAIALGFGVSAAIEGEEWGSYIYIAIFTGVIGLFMYWFKKKNRLYLEKRDAEKAQKEDA